MHGWETSARAAAVRWVLAFGLVVYAPLAAAAVERVEETPAALKEVGVDEHLGQQIPINLRFTDASGAQVALHEVLRGSRPALLTLNYADCPMLCNLQLDGLAEGLRGVGLVPGKDYDVVTVSINPAETQERTQGFAKKYHDKVGGEDIVRGWHFLRGEQQPIEALARAVGYGYTYVPSQKEYAHTAVVAVLMPDASISRYLYGVVYNPRDVRLALIEAAKGEVGTTLDRILLYCFHYDASTGRYAPMASNIMRLGGFLTALVLGAYLLLAWRQGRRNE